jgi:hypothetical protein
MSRLANRVAAGNRVTPPRQFRQIRPLGPLEVMAAVLMIVGLLVGIWIGHSGGARTPTEKSTVKTVIVSSPSPVVSKQPVPFVPSSCIDASNILAKMQPLLSRILAEPNVQSDIITQVKSGITLQDPRVLSSAATQENAEHNNMADVQQELMDYWTSYQADQAQCTKEVGK